MTIGPGRSPIDWARLGRIAVAVTIFLAGPAVAQNSPVKPSAARKAEVSVYPPGAPARERAFIDLFMKARAEYAAAASPEVQQAIRLGLQIQVHDFLGLGHNVQNWAGTFKTSRRTEEGDRTIEIEIGPELSVRTWDTRYFDRTSQTLIRAADPLTPVADTLIVGQPVVFTAILIGGMVGSDRDMIDHPQIIARFSDLKPAG